MRCAPEILEGTYRFPTSDGSGQNRDNQKIAFELLTKAGYVLKGGRLIEGATGQPFTFEILAQNRVQEAILLSYARGLEPLGIQARVRIVDSAQYQARLNTYDYDMIQTTWYSSLSPGNEQLFRWSAKTAATPGSYNFAGVANPAADAMIEAMLAAESKEAFVSAVRALDRVLLSGDYVIPMFHVPYQWMPHWAYLKHPEKTPVFGWAAAIDCWWTEKTRMTIPIPPHLNLAEYCLAAAARATPDKSALLVYADAETGEPVEAWTFAGLEDAVLRVAAALQDRGIAKGERLLIRLDNTSTFPILFLGAIAAGLVAVPASSQLTAEEAEFLLADTGATVVALRGASAARDYSAPASPFSTKTRSRR